MNPVLTPVPPSLFWFLQVLSSGGFFNRKAVSTFGRLREIKYEKTARKMYKVTYQGAFEMQKRIRRPCGFSVGVSEGLSHFEDFNFKNRSRARRGCVSRRAGENWSSWRHLKDYKKCEVSPQDTSQLKILWNSRIWHPRSLSALHMGRWCYFELECGRSPLCLQCRFTHFGGKKTVKSTPNVGPQRDAKNRDECGGNRFILILKDNLFYSAAVWRWMCKLCSSVKISRLDNNWGFCDVYVYRKKPPAFCRGTSEHGQLFTVPTLHSPSWPLKCFKGLRQFCLFFLLLSLPACFLHTLPVTIK